jgi:ribosomal-protein-alanine N-acetyltransferase
VDFISATWTGVCRSTGWGPNPTCSALRFFAGQAFHSTQLAWGLLLDQCSVELRKNGAKAIYSIALQDWYRDLLEASGFLLDTRIVVLEKPLNSKMDGGTIPAGYQLVRMQPMELNEVWDLDKSSFSPLWQMSHEDILTAFHVSENCTVIRNDNGELIGYQISNSLPTGGHLARIAVKPSEQGKGLGKILLADLTNRFVDMGTQRITVNTQEDNSTALGLYERNGFIRTGETYPVFRMDL